MDCLLYTSYHEPYAMEAAMAKMYASDIALEVTNDALQIFGGSGFLKGMEVERAYRDAKITTIYEGTNEIQRVVKMCIRDSIISPVLPSEVQFPVH